MGDRCYLSITLRGRIETVEDFDSIVEAFDIDGLQPNDDSGDVARHFVAAVKAGDNPTFHDYECNYANIDETETTLQAMGLPYYVSHEEGGGYPAGCWSWSMQNGKTESTRTTGGGPVISVESLRQALNAEAPLDAIREMIADADVADGAGLPNFDLSAEVRAHLGIPLAGDDQRKHLDGLRIADDEGKAVLE